MTLLKRRRPCTRGEGGDNDAYTDDRVIEVIQGGGVHGCVGTWTDPTCVVPGNGTASYCANSCSRMLAISVPLLSLVLLIPVTGIPSVAAMYSRDDGPLLTRSGRSLRTRTLAITSAIPAINFWRQTTNLFWNTTYSGSAIRTSGMSLKLDVAIFFWTYGHTPLACLVQAPHHALPVKSHPLFWKTDVQNSTISTHHWVNYNVEELELG